jgi:purine-nucleoside phosphorylase
MTRRIEEFAELQAIARASSPRIALILGSGLADLADRLNDAVELPFGALAGLEAPSVPGHRGVLLTGTWVGVPILIFAGRLHGYEGHPWRRVVQPVHLARELGATILLATNAAGGIRVDLQPGDIMALDGHIDCTRPGWWREQPVRFHADCYSRRLMEFLPIPRGAYAQFTGPSYETPAEIRALNAMDVAAVGMSTAREIQTARNLGMECAAISCITNKAAGLGIGPIHHDEVLEANRQVQARMIALLESFIAQVAR